MPFFTSISYLLSFMSFDYKKMFSFIKQNFVKILIILVIIGLGVAVVISTQQTKHWEDKYNKLAKEGDKANKKGEVQTKILKETVYEEKIKYLYRKGEIQKIYLKAKEQDNAFKETPAGRVMCRDVDRVREIDALDLKLFSTLAPKGSFGPMPSDTSKTPE